MCRQYLDSSPFWRLAKIICSKIESRHHEVSAQVLQQCIHPLSFQGPVTSDESIASTSRAECAVYAGDEGAQCSMVQGYELPEGSSSLWWDFSPSHTSEISPRV